MENPGDGISDAGIVFNVQQIIPEANYKNNHGNMYYLGLSAKDSYITLAELDGNYNEKEHFETGANLILNKWYKITLFLKNSILNIEITNESDSIIYSTSINDPLSSLGIFGIRSFRQRTDFDSFR